MVNFAKGSINSFSMKPIAIGVSIEAINSVLAMFEIIYAIHEWLLGETAAG